MLSLKIKAPYIFLIAFLGIMAGIVLMQVLPILTTNISFVIAIPLICAFLLIMVIDVKAMLIILLFTRALLDHILNTTKLEIFGENIGVGGVINFLVIFLACILLLRDPKRLFGKTTFRWWGVFLTICFIAITYSPVPGRAIRLFLNLASYMSMIAIPFFLINSARDKKFWLKILLLSSFLPVMFANYHLLKGGSYSSSASMRIEGTFTHPNILAFYLVLMIALSFFTLRGGLPQGNRVKRNVLRLYIANMLVLLLTTKTRSAWISCWAMFFIYGILRERKFVILSLSLPFLALLNESIMDRVRDLFHGTKLGVAKAKLNSFAWRIELWKSSIGLIKRRLITGHGLASFRMLSRGFFELKEKGVPAHNIFLELLFETGIFGLISYIGIFISLLKKFGSHIGNRFGGISAQNAVVFAYIIGLLIASIADNMLYYLAFNWYLWFFLGIILRGGEFDHEEKDVGDNTVV